MTPHQIVLVAAALAALVTVVLGVFAWLSRRAVLGIALTAIGTLGLGLLTAVFIVQPLLRKPVPPPELAAIFNMQADAALRSLKAQAKYDEPGRLNRYDAQVYSQGGEDGLLQEIFRRIGTTNKTFCEFGSADGTENNSALLVTLGWGGLWMDGDGAAIERARARYADAVGKGRLQVQRQFITAENIETLMSAAKLPAELDLLSIDIDRNDYYVWQKITNFRPRVVVIEYNAMFPPGVDWVIPYDAQSWWDQRTSYWGASLSALERLGRTKGYSLVACTLTGVNAFFVRDDLLGDKFSSPYTAEHHYEPSRMYLIGYKPGFIRNPR
jgi:hypothetical protein